MKLSNQTLSILRNFASINSGIWVDAGTQLKTVSLAKNMLAEATVNDDFPVSFGIYDLNEFLSVLSIHKDAPDLDFDEHHVIVQGFAGRSKVKYRVTDKQMITTPPDKKIKFPTPDVSFTLNESDFAWITNAAKVLKSPNIGIQSDGTKVFLIAFDYKNDSAHIDSLELEVNGNGAEYTMFYKTEDLSKLIPGTYDVQFSQNGISSYQHTGINLHYYLMFESDSKYSS